MANDPFARNLVGLAKDGKTRRFWQDGGLLYTKGHRLYVPLHGNLRRKIMKECHDSKWAGHPGMHRTLALVSERYYWPRLREDVEAYVRTCLVCQQDKVENQAPAGLLEPLPIAEHPWECLTMDFIVGMPKSDGFGSIMVVVDRFSKYATFIPASRECPADEAARLFLKNIVKYWGLPRNIISDRDGRFIGKFWTELFKLLGTDLNFSTSMHPQTDGQTERTNALVELYLRHFVNASQRDWPKLLDVAQFSFNLHKNESTGRSPFEIVMGYQPVTPNTLVTEYKGSSPSAFKFAKEWHEDADLARACLHKAAKRMKKFADQKRRPMEYQVGDLVLVKLHLLQRTRGQLHKGLLRRYEGPFRITKKVGKVSYKLELPSKLRFHPVFHVSMLKPYHPDPEDPTRTESHRAPIGVRVAQDKDVEYIMAERYVPRKSQPRLHEYMVKWKGLPESESSWEAEESLWQAKDQIRKFHEDATRASQDLVGENVTAQGSSPQFRPKIKEKILE